MGTMQDHVGLQSPIDVHEFHDSKNSLQYRGRDDITPPPNGEEGDKFDYDGLLVLEEAPLRYDVDIVTKLIVYAGIGFCAVYPTPLLFQFISQLL
jgi:hypothetical protein